MSEKKHLSASQINMYLMCGYAWYRRYVCKDYRPATPSLIKGITGHRMCEINNRWKLNHGVEYGEQELKKVIVNDLDKAFQGEVTLNQPQKVRGKLAIKQDIRDELFACVPLYLESSKSVHPVSVEYAQVLTHPDWIYDIKYVMDMETKEGQIVDYKFPGKAKNQGDADTDNGLTLYCLAYFAKHGELPKSVAMDTFVSYHTPKKRELKASHAIILTDRTMTDFQIMMDKISAITRGIAAEIHLPAAPGSWKCSEKYCEYWTDCKYVNQERIAAAEQNKEGK